MSDKVCDTLKQLISQYGIEICRDYKRLKGLLKDYCGEYKREINVLIMAVNEGIVEEILNYNGSKLNELQISKLIQKICENTGLTEENAKWAILTWIDVLDNKIYKDAEDKGSTAESYVNTQENVSKSSKELLAEGFLNYIKRDYGEAIKCYNKVIELEPENIEAWYEKGNILEQLRHYEEAINCYDKVLMLYDYKKRSDEVPKYYNVWINKVRCLRKLGLFAEAEHLYNIIKMTRTSLMDKINNFMLWILYKD